MHDIIIVGIVYPLRGFLVPNYLCFIFMYLEKLGYQKTSGRVQTINLKKGYSMHDVWRRVDFKLI